MGLLLFGFPPGVPAGCLLERPLGRRVPTHGLPVVSAARHRCRPSQSLSGRRTGAQSCLGSVACLPKPSPEIAVLGKPRHPREGCFSWCPPQRPRQPRPSSAGSERLSQTPPVNGASRSRPCAGARASLGRGGGGRSRVTGSQCVGITCAPLCRTPCVRRQRASNEFTNGTPQRGVLWE